MRDGPRAVGIALLAALAASQAALVVLNPLLPDVAQDLGVSVATAGQLRTVSGLAAGIAALTAGLWATRLGLRELLFVGVGTLAGFPRPPREREKLPCRPPQHARRPEHGAEPRARSRRRSRRAAEQQDDRDQGHAHRDDQPSQPPAHLAHDADERHADDPRERRPEKCDRENARPIRRRRPLRGGRNCRRVRDSDPESRNDLCRDQEREVGSERRHERPDRERHHASEQEPPEADARRPQPRRERRDPRRQARDRPQLTRGRYRDAEIARDVGQ